MCKTEIQAMCHKGYSVPMLAGHEVSSSDNGKQKI